MAIKLCISGASGRMGSTILKVLHEYPNFELVSALEKEHSSILDSPVLIENPPLNHSVLYSSDIEDCIKKSDVVVDFSSASFTEKLLSACEKFKKPVLIATTGHNENERAMIAEFSKRIPILLASNTSLGVFVLNELSKIASQYLGPTFDVEICETHHRLKKDAPSGTALTLARVLSEERADEIVTNRGDTFDSRKDREIGIQSLRGGDVVGEHTVHFFGPGERIEVTHRCTDRTVFARGALRLVEKLITLPAKLYNPSNLFKL